MNFASTIIYAVEHVTYMLCINNIKKKKRKQPKKLDIVNKQQLLQYNVIK